MRVLPTPRLRSCGYPWTFAGARSLSVTFAAACICSQAAAVAVLAGVRADSPAPTQCSLRADISSHVKEAAARRPSRLALDRRLLAIQARSHDDVRAGSKRSSGSLRPTRCPPVSFMRPFRNYTELGLELRRLGLNGVGVDVGVGSGKSTTRLLSSWRDAALFVQIDHWGGNEYDAARTGGQRGIESGKEKDLRDLSNACKAGAEMKAMGYAGNVVQCKGLATSCARQIPDDSLDFVYIDTRTDRRGILEDIANFWPKLRLGGVLAGSDYDGYYQYGRFGLEKGALDDFFVGQAPESPEDLRQCPRQPTVAYRESHGNAWAVRK